MEEGSLGRDAWDSVTPSPVLSPARATLTLTHPHLALRWGVGGGLADPVHASQICPWGWGRSDTRPILRAGVGHVHESNWFPAPSPSPLPASGSERATLPRSPPPPPSPTQLQGPHPPDKVEYFITTIPSQFAISCFCPPTKGMDTLRKPRPNISSAP